MCMDKQYTKIKKYNPKFQDEWLRTEMLNAKAELAAEQKASKPWYTRLIG